jgi:hypothetical protein
MWQTSCKFVVNLKCAKKGFQIFATSGESAQTFGKPSGKQFARGFFIWEIIISRFDIFESVANTWQEYLLRLVASSLPEAVPGEDVSSKTSNC